MDFAQYFHPAWAWAAESLQSGRLPLWDPLTNAGQPYWAHPGMACNNPILWLFYRVMEPVPALNGLCLFHHLLLAIGAWLVLRDRGTLQAAPSALAISLSVPILTMLWAPSLLFTFAWMPWVLWGMRGIIRGRRGSFLALSVAFGLQCASGYPPLAYLTLLFSGLETALTEWKGPKTALLLVPKVFLALLFSGLFNASWILPFLEVYPLTILASRATQVVPLDGGVLRSLTDPFPHGHPFIQLGIQPEYLYSILYFGAAAFVVTLTGLAARRVSITNLVLFILALLLCLGENFPLDPFLKRWLPGYTWVFRSGYLLPFAAWYGIRLAAETLASDQVRPWFPRGRRWMGGLLFVLACLHLFDTVPARGLSWFIGFLGLAAFLWLDTPKSRLREMAALILMGAACWPLARSLNPFVLDDILTDLPASFQPMNQGGRLWLHPNMKQRLAAIQSRSVLEDTLIAKEHLLYGWPNVLGSGQLKGYNSFGFFGVNEWVQKAADTDGPSREAAFSFLRVDQMVGGAENGFQERRNDGSPARIWDRIIPSPTVRCFKSLVPSPPLSIPQRADQEGYLPGMTQRRDYFLRSLHLVQWEANRQIVDLKGGGKALMVAPEALSPGWRVRVDGREARPLAVNGIFRGVEVPEDGRRVEWTYEPKSFRLGLFFSLLVFGLWVALTGAALKRS